MNRYVSASLYQETRVENSRHQPPDKGLDVTAVLEPNILAQMARYSSIVIIERVD